MRGVRFIFGVFNSCIHGYIHQIPIIGQSLVEADTDWSVVNVLERLAVNC